MANGCNNGQTGNKLATVCQGKMADSVDSNSELARSAKRKLQMLPNYLFEEVAMDVYDEIDRRETENCNLSSINSLKKE